MALVGLPLTIRSRVHDGVAVLELVGKVMGGADAELIRRSISSLVAEGIPRIVLDFGEVPWVNSQGLGVLLSCATSLRPPEGAIKLLRVNDRVRSVLDVTRLSAHFEIFDDEDSAIQSFREAPPGVA